MSKDKSNTLSADFTENMRLWKTRLPEGKLGLAVSGGGDSVCLLYLMKEWADQNSREIEVVSVNHNLRDESVKEAESVERHCKKLGVVCTIKTWTDWNKSGNLQDEARQARRLLIHGWAEENDIVAIATGHTADDQAETFLMRLARGSGVDGLSGMASLRLKNNLPWFRPLLTFRRNSLRSYLKSKRVKWVDDPSNQDEKFDRIKMRKAQSALDKLGLTTDRLVETATRMSTARRALERLTMEKAQSCTTPTEFGSIKLDLEAFRDLSLELRYRLFAHSLMWVSGAIYRPRFDALLESAAKMSAGKDHTLSGCHIISTGQSAEICREVSAMPDSEDFNVLYDQRWRISGTEASKGLSIRPLGEKGLPQCENWRAIGASRVCLMGTPAIWRDDELITAPLAGKVGYWICRLDDSTHKFFTSIVTH